MRSVISVLALLGAAWLNPAMAQDDWEFIDATKVVKRDTIRQDGFQLTFVQLTDKFDPAIRQQLIDAFFVVYPKEVSTYNPKSTREVVFVIDPAYTGVAAASGKTIRFNPEWYVKNPKDIDVVTHECMHLVQCYKDFEPGWITEGIADYVRAKFGVNNAAGNWSLPDLKPTHKYTSAYRVTARFLIWIEKKYNPELVVNLNEAMRKGKYKDQFWKKQTGKTVDELWSEYSSNPQI